MKSRFIAALLLSGMLMTACADEIAEPEAVEIAEPEAEEIAEPKADENDNSLYESFLNNEAKVHYDPSKEGGRVNEVQEGDYSLSELIEAIKEAHGDVDGTGPELEDIRYSYINCGNDGKEEFAMSISAPDAGMGWGQTIIIKDIDGELKLIYSNNRHIKESFDVNDCGYVFISGGDGLGYFGAGNGVINDDGYHDLYFISAYNMNYSDENGGSVWINDADMQIPAGLGLSSDYYLIEFGILNPYDGSVDMTYSYAEITKEDHLAVGRFDPAKLDGGDESIYEESNPFRQYLESQGLKVCSLSDMAQMMEDREEAMCITPDIKDAGTKEWQILDYNH